MAQLEEQRNPNPQVASSSLAEGLSAVVLVAGDLAFNQERGVRFLYGALRECGQIGKALDFRSREYGFEPRRSYSGPRSSIERAPACGAGGSRFESWRGYCAGIAKLARQRASNPSSGVQIPLPALGRRGPVRQGTRLIIGVASDKRKVVGSNPTASTVEAWRNWLAQHLAKVSSPRAVWVQVPPLPPPAQWPSWQGPRLQIEETGVRVSPGSLGDVAQRAAHPPCKRDTRWFESTRHLVHL